MDRSFLALFFKKEKALLLWTKEAKNFIRFVAPRPAPIERGSMLGDARV
jgi:hypothetical protein